MMCLRGLECMANFCFQGAVYVQVWCICEILQKFGGTPIVQVPSSSGVFTSGNFSALSGMHLAFIWSANYYNTRLEAGALADAQRTACFPWCLLEIVRWVWYLAQPVGKAEGFQPLQQLGAANISFRNRGKVFTLKNCCLRRIPKSWEVKGFPRCLRRSSFML